MATDIQRLAKKVISLVHEKIQEEFGLKIVMGAELEFTAIVPDRRKIHLLPHEKTNPLQIPLENKKDDLRPAKDKRDSHNVRLFEGSPYVTNLYKEKADSQYELVFSHLSKEGSPSLLAHSVTMAKRRLERKLKEQGVKEVNFSPVAPLKTKPPSDMYPEKNNGQGLQINFSLENENGDNILNNTDKSVVKRINDVALDVVNETISLVSPTSESFDRYNLDNIDNIPRKLENNNTSTSAISYRTSENNVHSENRVAGADADPYLAISTTMMAIYDALKNQEITISDGEFNAVDYEKREYSYSFPKDKKEAFARLEEGTIVQNMLNELESGLGDRFKNEALEYAKIENHEVGSFIYR